jgi:excisionase family DNA binding protein
MNEAVRVGALDRSSRTASTVTAAPASSRTPEYYVDAREAAKFLGIHRRTVLQMARDDSIPAHPLGDGRRKLWRFLLSELDEWMRGRVNSARRPCSPNRSDIQ